MTIFKQLQLRRLKPLTRTSLLVSVGRGHDGVVDYSDHSLRRICHSLSKQDCPLPFVWGS